MSPYRIAPLAADQERLLIPIRRMAFVWGFATGIWLAFSMLAWAAAIAGAAEPASDVDARSYPCAAQPTPQQLISDLWIVMTEDDGGAR